MKENPFCSSVSMVWWHGYWNYRGLWKQWPWRYWPKKFFILTNWGTGKNLMLIEGCWLTLTQKFEQHFFRIGFIIRINQNLQNFQKSSVLAFPLWFLQKQNSWVKNAKNSMKDIVGISIIAYWPFHLRWGTRNKSRKTSFSVKVDF